ncbi:hypothetical protein M5K25_004473 [Dendrobium thyrsiflorum]|uniref:Uncharacterized protein n=1 Tax=Dendrobium thyrsiflorum TaxID=117978 RepID=A0ABD0VLR3_DENTH
MAPKEKKLKEPKEDQKLKTAGTAVAAAAAAGALIWGVSRYFSSSSNDEGLNEEEKHKMMSAPGRPNEYIRRDNFVNNPQQYFSKLHKEEREKSRIERLDETNPKRPRSLNYDIIKALKC